MKLKLLFPNKFSLQFLKKAARFLLICPILMITFSIQAADDGKKPRVLILTDIENEPDDAESLVRFLLYSNHFDVEGIVATTSCWQRDKIADWRIHEIIDAYGKVRNNLEKHEPGFPSHTSLKKCIKKGFPDFGMVAVGEGKDSEGSEWIIKVVDKDDERPVWIPVWGGANCLAQALWKVKETRTEDEINKFVSKIRVYTISDQDNSGPWIRNTFHDLFYIVSPGFSENGAYSYFYATWIGISGERRYNFLSGADKYIIDNEWVDANIQNNHGPLGKEYPDIAYIMEGDTPSFLYLINNGLNSPEHPNWGSWGGRYELYKPYTKLFFHEPEQRPIWTDTDDWVEVNGINYINNQATIWRWRDHYQNDFAARMDWCLSSFEKSNHPPVARLNHPGEMTVKSGETIKLDASKSTDPDGNALTYKWIYYKEAGTYQFPVETENDSINITNLKVPSVTKPKKIHFVVAVTDDGDPKLTRYERVIITITP
jgi:Cellulose-binding Sde182, nucleoside hydrolase-like domain/Cellulose-binding protein Sde0182, C-terminal domain